MTNYSFAVFDGIYSNDPGQKQIVFFDVKNVTPQTICITMDQPLTITQMLNGDTSRCEAIINNTGKINATISGSLVYQYRRLFLNVLGNKELGSSIKQVFFTTFGVSSQYNYLSYAIYPKKSRANENLKLIAVYLNDTKSLEVTNQLLLTMKDYEKTFEEGTSNITKLAVSDNIEFGYENSQVDDTAGI